MTFSAKAAEIDTANGPGVHFRHAQAGNFVGWSGNSRYPRKSDFLSPGHDYAKEGRQPPGIARGDAAALEEGMTVSVGPGLIDSDHGCDHNHGHCLRVTKKSGVSMGDGARYSKERMFLTL